MASKARPGILVNKIAGRWTFILSFNLSHGGSVSGQQVMVQDRLWNRFRCAGFFSARIIPAKDPLHFCYSNRKRMQESKILLKYCSSPLLRLFYTFLLFYGGVFYGLYSATEFSTTNGSAHQPFHLQRSPREVDQHSSPRIHRRSMS